MSGRMKNTSKILSVILSVILLLSIFPMQTFAEDFQNRQSVQAAVVESDITAEEPSEILYEVTSKREANKKVFKKSDGTYTAMVSPVPMHYEQDGEWVEIDNSLKVKNKKLENINGSFHVSFPNALQEAPVSVLSGDYQLSFSLDSAENSKAKVKEKKSVKGSDEMPADDILDKLSSTVTYKNVLKHTDLEYVLSGNSVKENIIIKKASAAQESYCFHITADGLTGTVGEDGEVIFRDAENKEIFTIPAPVMIDAENAVSGDIDVIFTEKENGGYTLQYTPSAEWLRAEDRKYPVKLDPAVEEKQSFYEYRTMVIEEFPEDNFYDCYQDFELWPENYWEFGNIETYLYPIPRDCHIPSDNVYNVTLCMRGMVNGILGAYYVNESWDPQSITYDTRPQTEPEPFDYYYSESDFYDEGSWINFDMTQYARDKRWLGGIMLRLLTESADCEIEDWYAIFNRLPNDDQNEMYLYYEYTDTEVGCLPVAEKLSASAGRAGTVMIDEYTADLSIARDDIAISGNIMPAQISFRYNMFDLWNEDFKYYNASKNVFAPCSEILLTYGRGWTTAYNQFFFITDEGDVQKQYMYYTGDTVIPISVSKEDGKWIIEDAYPHIYGTSGYTFTVDVSEDDGREFYELFNSITVRNPNGNLQKYDANGRLIKIYREKYPEQSIDIVYLTDLASGSVSDRDFLAIDYVTDGVGRKYDFSFSDLGFLDTVQCYAADGTAITAGSTEAPLKMSYQYMSACLQSVTFPDGKTVSYDFNNKHKITSITNIDKYRLTFTWSGERITRYYEVAFGDDGTGWVGATTNITKETDNQVTISQGKQSPVTKKFDLYGRSVMVTDQNGNCTYYDYSSRVDGMPVSFNIMSAEENLIANGNFENGADSWQLEGLHTESIILEHCNTGVKAVNISGNASGENGISQTITELQAGMYTLSAFVSACDADTDSILKMAVIAISEDGTVLKEEIREIEAPAMYYSQYFVTTEAPSGTCSIQVRIYTDSASGAFYVDDVQLEQGSYTSDINYALNGDFRNGTDGWQYTNASGWSLIDAEVNKKSVKAISLSTENCNDGHLIGEIAVNGKKGDRIAVGAWFKAENLILNRPDYIFDLSKEFEDRSVDYTVSYAYTDENGDVQTETSVIYLREHMNKWEYLMHSLVLKGDCKYITVAVNLHNIVHAVELAGLNVFKSADYDMETDDELFGELPDTDNTHFCVCGDDCAYGYDCPCTCTSAESCTCDQCSGCPCADCTEFRCECRCESEEVCDCPQCRKKFDITYDEFGNLLSLKLMGKDLGTWLSMMTSRNYDTLGNYITSSTDENGLTVRYSYNPNNGMLNSVTDARGNLTEYTYDAIGALTQIKTPVSELTNLLSDDMITSYEYKNDRVSKIRHNDFAYNITYDAWGNVKSIFVGALDTVLTIPFVEYTYGTGDYRSRIEKISFKNGNTITYRYDDANITGISYDDGVTYRFTYAYDELGYLTKIQDNSQNRIIYYNMDFVEVYEKNALLYKAYTDSDGNLAEMIDGTLFVTKQYDAQLIEDTGERAAKTGVNVGDNELSVVSKTDKFGRRTEQSVLTGSLESANAPFAMVTASYTYKQHQKNGEAMAGSRVDMLSNTVKAAGKADSTPYTFAYEYDANNNITREYAIRSDGSKVLRYRYTYDEANQLVRTDDNVAGKTYIYTYNKGGNRISVKTYAYTLSTVLGEVQDMNLALYGDLVWRDRMTSFNDKVVFYDSIGNPKSYDGNTFAWEGRQLKSISNANGKTVFAYDADGLRAETRVYNANNTLIQTDKYIWKDGVLDSHVLITSGKSKTAKILYGADSQAIGYISDSGEVVMFIKNLQGDVIALVDASGKVVVEYSYDAWGNMTYKPLNGTTQAQASRLVKLCPITYRGYNYDFTTGLYYLQSRYYNPEWGRFLNCDDTNILLATQGEDHGANLFAYCNNDPVNRVDYTGYFGYYHTEGTQKIANEFFNNPYLQKLLDGVIYPDEKYPATRKCYSPYAQGFHFNINSMRPFAADSRTIRAEEYVEKALSCLDSAQKAQRLGKTNVYKNSLLDAFFNFGIALHPLQDMISHSGVGGNVFVPVFAGNVYIGSFYMHLGTSYDDPNTRYLNTRYSKGQMCDIVTAVFCLGIYQELERRQINEALK